MDMKKWIEKRYKDGLRHCPSCGTYKDPSNFYKNRCNKGGLNGHCKVCVKARSNKLDAVLIHKKNHLITRYKISFEEYIKMYGRQNGLCAICGNPIDLRSKNKLEMVHVDHDHVTGKVRGLLCFLCNNGLGCFKDSVHIVKEALQYLMIHDEGVL